MHDAYMIVDFNNPVSMSYMEKSLKSFAPLKDILNIIPVQCTTPDTLPIEPCGIVSGVLNSILHSHHMLIRKIADGEDILIMEHDAALINEDSFREMYDACWGNVEGFFPGVAMELYSLSPKLAVWMDNHLNNILDGPSASKRYIGPMTIMQHSANSFIPSRYIPEKMWLLPSKYSIQDYISLGFVQNNQYLGYGELFEVCCKQYYCKTSNNTNLDYSDMFTDTSANPKSVNGPLLRDFIIFDKF